MNTWWTSLDEEQQQEAMEDHPELLRDLDGIPTVVRDELNREHLDEEIERLEAEEEELQERIDGYDYGIATNGPRTQAQTELEELQEALSTLTTMQGNLKEDGSDRYPRRWSGTLRRATGVSTLTALCCDQSGVNADHVTESGFTSDVHVPTARNDRVTYTTGFTPGPDPTGPDSGANEFTSSPGTKGGRFPLGDAHSEYFHPGTKSLRCMGEVIAGSR